MTTGRIRVRMMGSIASGVFACLCVGVGIGEAGTSSADTPTYTEDVAPILMANCVTCHRPGQVAPMSLTTYAETRPWARAIRNEVEPRRMPPWHAAPGVLEPVPALGSSAAGDVWCGNDRRDGGWPVLPHP